MLDLLDLDVAYKRVLVRSDLNVPLSNGEITSTKRIEAAIPTLRYLLHQKANVILMSHLGRPKEGMDDPSLSLRPVASCLKKMLGSPVSLVAEIDTLETRQGEIALLENTRFWKGEKENDPILSQQLASLCDIFVMDAFATAHRKEASTYGVAEYAPIACAGPLLLSELNALKQIIATPKMPLVAIVGGSKVSSKLMILKNLLTKVDCLIVGGGIANTFLAASGYDIGQSLSEKDLIHEAEGMLAYAMQQRKIILIPEDVVVASNFTPTATATIRSVDEIRKDEMVLDVGHQTMNKIRAIIAKAKTILWNGPLGVFEWEPFSSGTAALATAIGESEAYTVAGGGDTLAAIEKYHLEEKISYISTGGGAFLECLEGKTLPAVEILQRRAVTTRTSQRGFS